MIRRAGIKAAGVLISLVGLVGVILVVPGVLICYAALGAATALEDANE